MLTKLKQELQRISNPEKAKLLQRYFKTGTGEYAEGDVFIGITVPQLRTISKNYASLDLNDIQELLNSEIHEHRIIALVILIKKYKTNKKEIVDFYLRNTFNINNWDLVDTSAPYILGDYLLNQDRSILYKFARSNNLWERRISIISTYAFIKNNQFEETLKISKILLNDKHDLIHKAVGWMLREVGKKDQVIEEQFLDKHYKNMPRTMLRYAIENFDKEKRLEYLKK